VLERKGYYNELVTKFEGIREKRDDLNRDLRQILEDKMAVEDDIAVFRDQLLELRKVMAASQRTKRINDKFLVELEAGGLRAELALRKLKYASMPIQERAAMLRDEFRAAALGVEPGSPHAAEKMGSSSACNHTAVEVRDLSFESGGVRVAARLYDAAAPAGDAADAAALPVLVFFHGGGYVAGGLDTHDWICRSLAALARAAVVSVDYRRAPEARFPAAFDDAYAALRWVADGGLGHRPARLGVAGDSNGAALALACCLKARDDPQGPKIDLQVLFYPWADLRPDGPSMQEGRDVPLLADMDWNRGAYAPPHPDPPAEEVDDDPAGGPEHPLGEDGRPWFEDPRASPLLARSFAGLPTAFLAYASTDGLAGESLRLAERMRREVAEDAVHTLHIDGPLGHGFAKHADLSQAHVAVSAAAAFASAALRPPTSPARKRGGDAGG